MLASAAAAAVVGGFHVVAVEVGGYKNTRSSKFGVFIIVHQLVLVLFCNFLFIALVFDTSSSS